MHVCGSAVKVKLKCDTINIHETQNKNSDVSQNKYISIMKMEDKHVEFN